MYTDTQHVGHIKLPDVATSESRRDRMATQTVVQLVCGILAVVLVAVIIMRRKSKKKQEDEF